MPEKHSIFSTLSFTTSTESNGHLHTIKHRCVVEETGKCAPAGIYVSHCKDVEKDICCGLGAGEEQQLRHCLRGTRI